jgi:excisionase family DNA binding protein
LTCPTIASTTVLMNRGKRGTRNPFSDALPKPGPDRAVAALAAEASPVMDVFDHLAQCANLLTVNELAPLLAVSPKTIYSYVARNIIPHYKIAASVRFRARDIVEWLRSHAA